MRIINEHIFIKIKAVALYFGYSERAPSSVELIFHILPMTNNVPWPPSHILDLLWRLCWDTPIFQLASAFENWKQLLKTKYFVPTTCHVFLLSLLFVTFGWSILAQKSESGCSDQTLCHQTLAPPNQSFDSFYSSREKQKYLRKYSKSIQYLPPRLSHVSISLNSVKIFINISHDKTDWQMCRHSTTSQPQQTKAEEEEKICW